MLRFPSRRVAARPPLSLTAIALLLPIACHAPTPQSLDEGPPAATSKGAPQTPPPNAAASAPADPWLTDPSAVIGGYLAQSRLQPRRVLLLGTFHFQDAGLDAHKPQHRFDALTADRQRQIAEVVAELEAFAPHVVCVERRPELQEKVDTDYAGFRRGGLRDVRNEIVQIGYRLADRLGLERVHAVDAGGRWLEPRVDAMAWARDKGLLAQLATPLQGVVGAYLAEHDRFVDRAELRDILRFMNHPDVLAASHAAYLVGPFHAAFGNEYPGVDGFTSHWFNRNLRIFVNVRRVSAPGQRVVVLIGAGHVPILRHCMQASPEFELVEVADVVGASPRAAAAGTG